MKEIVIFSINELFYINESNKQQYKNRIHYKVIYHFLDLFAKSHDHTPDLFKYLKI